MTTSGLWNGAYCSDNCHIVQQTVSCLCLTDFLLSVFLTADALTGVLTKVNRMDIVTLLEGPIFDYGNISGTRSFADDNAVYLDQADGKV